MTDCATKKLWLAEAEYALHKLQTGAKQQSVSFGAGKSVTFTQANVRELKSYIADLTDQVAVCDGAERSPRAPVRFNF